MIPKRCPNCHGPVGYGFRDDGVSQNVPKALPDTIEFIEAEVERLEDRGWEAYRHAVYRLLEGGLDGSCGTCGRKPVHATTVPVIPDLDGPARAALAGATLGQREGVRRAIQTVELCRHYTSELFPDNSGVLNFVDIRRIIRALESLNESPQQPA